MRLRRFQLDKYGNFDALDLTLAAEPGRINLIVAPNGAGKSVLRQAFHDLLFGYEAKAKMNYRFRTGLQLRAEAVTAAGDALAFGWRHPGGRAWGDASEQTRFGAALGNVTPRQLQHLFALDTAHLRAGGEELAQGGDSLGLALLSGTGELMSAKAARAGLAARRDTLWQGSGKSSRPLAKAAKGLDDVRKAARNAVQLPLQRERALSAFEAEEARLKQARESHAAMQVKASQLARIDRTRRFLEEHRTASAWLAAHPDAPLLPDSLGGALAGARTAVVVAGNTLGDARRAVAAAEAKQGAIVLDAPALAHAAELGAMQSELVGVERAAADSVKRETERGEHLMLVARALRDLGIAIPADQAATLLPRVADETTARKLIGQHEGLVRAVTEAERRLRAAEDSLRDTEIQSVVAPAPAGDLAALLGTIRADRDPARHRDDATRAALAAEADAAQALAAIPGWTGDAAALRVAAAPEEAVFERLDAARTASAAALRQIEGEMHALAAQREALTRDLRSHQGRTLPNEAAIAAARAARDQGWALVYQRAFTSHPPDAAQERAYAGEEPLALVFERHLRAADALADQRLEELPRVREVERLNLALAATGPDWDALMTRAALGRADVSAARAAFEEQCALIGLDRQASLADVRLALSRRRAAINAVLAAERLAAQRQAVLAAQTAWAGQLRLLVPECGGDQLDALLAAADARLAAEAEAAKARIKQEADRATAKRQASQEHGNLAAAQRALVAWQERWMACLAALGRPADEAPAATEAVLQCLRGLATADAEAANLGKRVAQMQSEVARFTQSVAHLATALGEAPGDGVFVTARRLKARHEAAQRQRTLAGAAAEQVATAQAALAEATETADRAQRVLDALVADCGAADLEEAGRQVELARERAVQERLRDEALAGLRAHGDGLSLMALQAEAASVSADQAVAERALTQAALADARSESEAASAAVAEQQRALAEAAAATDVTDAAAAQEGAAATFGQLLDDYLVLALAEQMLAQAVTEVEAKAGGNGVSRIASAFGRVTQDAYTIEGEEGSDGKTTLVAIERCWPGERKTLAQLSEGTRDQLYLALRIVAIEDHVASAAPLPFIADDILQTFDDDRAFAALEALLVLSRHTQVIVLTHHPHVKALAARLPPGSVHLADLGVH